jgi:hypothetical protein
LSVEKELKSGDIKVLKSGESEVIWLKWWKGTNNLARKTNQLMPTTISDNKISTSKINAGMLPEHNQRCCNCESKQALNIQ